jgi:hypothetical protein
MADLAWSDAYHQDVTLVDFRDVVEYLQWYRDGEGSATTGMGSRGHFGRLIIEEKGGKVWGVRINCHQDEYKRNRTALEEVLVPRRHPIFHEEGDDPLPVSEWMEQPICGKKYASRPPSKDPAVETHDVAAGHLILGGDKYDRRNGTMALLGMRLCGPPGQWHLPQDQWNGPIGSVLLTCREGTHLTAAHVTQLRIFCGNVLLPMGQHGGTVEEARERANLPQLRS